MKNILIIAGSTSSKSINRQLAQFAAKQIEQANVTELVILELALPMFSEDEEAANGHPAGATKFIEQVKAADAVILSLAEHNGSYSSAFKNAYDWASRVENAVWQNTPMLLMATSPGGRGGATVLEAASQTFPRMGADLKSTFSLPSFYDNFADGEIKDADLLAALKTAVIAL